MLKKISNISNILCLITLFSFFNLEIFLTSLILTVLFSSWRLELSIIICCEKIKDKSLLYSSKSLGPLVPYVSSDKMNLQNSYVFCYFFLFFYIYIQKCLKIHQESKEKLQKKLVKDIKIFLKKKKEKSNSQVRNDKKI